MIKKIFLGVGSVAVVTVGALILSNGSSVNADDEVIMKVFNDLKAEVESLKIQLNEANEKITELTNNDTEINQKLNNQSSRITIITDDIKNIRIDINNNTHKISNITDWQVKLYDFTRTNVTPGAFVSLENFRKSQQ